MYPNWIFNQNQSEFEFAMIRINSDLKFHLDQFELGLIRIQNLVRIDASD